MSARYRTTQIRVLGDGRTVEAALDIENASDETWSGGNGFAIGYHIFDPDTDTLVVDGARAPLERDVQPGEPAHVNLRFELPGEPGRYRIFISPMRENVGWFYQSGWRFILVDAVVEEGRVTLEQSRVVTQRTVARERAFRSIVRALVLPVLTIWRNRSLIRTMVRRDILGRYRGSFGGIFWTVLNPLLLMLTYYFVFGIVLQARFGSDPSRSGFVLYFLAGMLPWLAFSEAVGRSPTVMAEHRNFVKKLVFPVETLPVNLVASGLVTQAFAAIVFLAGLFAARGAVPMSVVWTPALLIPQVLFTLGVSWLLAALGVFVRDLGQVIGFLLTLWFFLTPICYPETALPPEAVPVLAKNPIFALVRGYRAVLLEGHAPTSGTLWKLWLIAAAVFVFGYAWFYKLRRSFADVI
jgi:lipopolysaccharide transport system permease protein